MAKELQICSSAMEACHGAEAVVIATEWDEFRTLDWPKVYASMAKPAFLFDGRNIVDAAAMRGIGFRVHSVGQGQPDVDPIWH